MKLSELFEGTECNVYGEDVEITNLSINSNKLQPGALFICLQGIRFDGHDFAQAAVNNGAVAVMCERPLEVDEAVTVVIVENSRKAMSLIASRFCGSPAQKLCIIGVTGTNGKTSSVFYLAKILRENGRTVGIIGTTGAYVNDSELGIRYATSTTPDAIELHQIFSRMRMFGVSHVVMEVTSHALALNKVDGITFEAALFTNLTQDHLDFHGTLEDYFQTKLKLFGMSKIGIINADDSFAARIPLEVSCPCVTYGIENSAGLRAENISFTSGGSSFDINGVNFHFAPAGKFNVYNILGVIGVAVHLGVPIASLPPVVSGLTGVAGRFQSIPNKRGFSVFVDYAHSPDSLENILHAVREITGGKVIALFGCGGDRDTSKRPVMGQIAGELADFCVLTSDNPRSEDPEAIIEDIESGIKPTGCGYIKKADRREAVFYAIGLAKPGDSVILAGKGHEEYQEFENKRRIPFSDVETAVEALRGVL